MEWKNTDRVLQAKDESNGNIAKYTYVTELTPADNGAKFTCRTYFNQPQPGTVKVKEASNIPTTDSVLTDYMSPQLTVYCKYCLYHIHMTTPLLPISYCLNGNRIIL